MLITIVSAVVVLGLLIFFHELGHFLMAKSSGVLVERFSIGFGHPLWTYKKGETEYCISWIPFGGYVKMLGEEVPEEVHPSEYHRSFAHKPLWVKGMVVAAGPVANIVLAVFLFFVVYTFAGIPYLLPEIGEVSEGSPAEEGGLQKGDRIIRISGVDIQSWNDFSDIVQKWHPTDGPLTIEIKRNGEIVTAKVMPSIKEVNNLFGETVKRPVIGVTASGNVEIEKVGIPRALIKSFEQTIYISKVFFISIVKLIQGIIPFNTLGGPIMIAQMAGQQAQAGFFPLMNFIALLSLNLAILNLLPFPALDGGHLLIFSIEAVIRRKIKEKVLEYINKVGFALLILLMIAVFFNDILRIFPWINNFLGLSGGTQIK